MINQSSINFAFLGSSAFSVFVLDELEKAGLKPALVVTTPDKPQGRKLVLTPTLVKSWAIERNIDVLAPEKLDKEFIDMLRQKTTSTATGSGDNINVFIVASYGKIIPEAVLNIPQHKTLNVHPSLLPKYRGATPLQSAILNDDKDTGVTVMRIDEKMDHGPIVAQKNIHIDEWPVYEAFEEMMAREGGQLLASTLPDWTAGKIKEQEQDHSQATYTKKIVKEDGLINLNDNARQNFLKVQAYHEWPGAYFFATAKNSQTQGDSDKKASDKKLRIKITDASCKNNQLLINRVVPEGSKEMSYADFEKGYKID